MGVSKMAVTLGGSFVTGTPLLHCVGGGDAEYVQVRSRVICETPTIYNNERKVLEIEVSAEMEKLTKDVLLEKPGSLWLSPLFNVSSDGFWKNVSETKKQTEEKAPGAISPSQEGSTSLSDVIGSSRGRRAPKQVVFTPEKVRALRKNLRATKTWHDSWYHSGIASRLAEECTED